MGFPQSFARPAGGRRIAGLARSLFADSRLAPAAFALVPGGSRRYRWSVIRGEPIAVFAHRAGASARFDLAPPVEGPTPHLVFDEESFEWRSPDDTRLEQDGRAVFVDGEGRVLGPVAPEPSRLE